MTQNKYIDPEHIVGGLYILSDPPGADVYIGRNPVIDSIGNIVRTPAILTDIPQGLYTITFKLIGYRDDIITTTVVGGYYSSVYGVLLPLPAPVSPT